MPKGGFGNPSAASPHTAKPACSKKIPMMFRTESPSSMTKILLRSLAGEEITSCCSYCGLQRLLDCTAGEILKVNKCKTWEVRPHQTTVLQPFTCVIPWL